MANSGMKLIIRNLSRKTTEEQLRKLFEAYGVVDSCDLVMDKETGGSKGFGFVEMPKDENALFAIKKLNNKEVSQSKIRVKLAEEK